MRPARLAIAVSAMAAVALAGTSAAVAKPNGPDTPVSSPAGPAVKGGGSAPGWPGQGYQCAFPPGDRFDHGYFVNERKAEAAAKVMERWLARHPQARKALAGRWYSVSSQHGAYHLSFTGNAEAYQAAMRKLAPDPARVCAGPALYTRGELDAAQRRVERDLAGLERMGLGWLQPWVDEPTNTLVIGIPEGARGDAAQILRRRYGGLVSLRVEVAPVVEALVE